MITSRLKVALLPPQHPRQVPAAAAVAVAPGAPAETQGRNDRPERDKPVNADLIEEFAVLWFQAPLVMSSRMQDFALLRRVRRLERDGAEW